MKFFYFVIALCAGPEANQGCEDILFSTTGNFFETREACQPHTNIWVRKNMNPRLAADIQKSKSVLSTCMTYEELVKVSPDAKDKAEKPGRGA
jgi:hypothetical protein